MKLICGVQGRRKKYKIVNLKILKIIFQFLTWIEKKYELSDCAKAENPGADKQVPEFVRN